MKPRTIFKRINNIDKPQKDSQRKRENSSYQTNHRGRGRHKYRYNKNNKNHQGLPWNSLVYEIRESRVNGSYFGLLLLSKVN